MYNINVRLNKMNIYLPQEPKRIDCHKPVRKETNSRGFIKDYTIHFDGVNKNKLNLMFK